MLFVHIYRPISLLSYYSGAVSLKLCGRHLFTWRHFESSSLRCLIVGSFGRWYCIFPQGKVRIFFIRYWKVSLCRWLTIRYYSQWCSYHASPKCAWIVVSRFCFSRIGMNFYVCNGGPWMSFLLVRYSWLPYCQCCSSHSLCTLCFPLVSATAVCRTSLSQYVLTIKRFFLTKHQK